MDSKSSRAQQQLGLTLVELLIALSVSTVVVMGAANLVIQTMQARSSAEELRRKRTEWNLARRFIEAEVSSATRVITDVAAIEIPKECGIESDEFTHAIVFPLERPMRVRNDASLRENFQVLPSAIYGVQTIDDGSMISGNASSGAARASTMTTTMGDFMRRSCVLMAETATAVR